MMMRSVVFAVAGLMFVACAPAEPTPIGGGGIPAVTVSGGKAPVSSDHTIAVSGTGEVKGIPDTLVVELGISLVRPDVSSATADAAVLANEVIEALIEKGVVREDIQTTNYSVYPEYRYTNEVERLIGYRVSNTIKVRIRPVESAGEAIDAAVAAGGDETVVNGVSFDIEQNQELIEAAREAAWNDAKTKAEQLAELAGIDLGEVVTITESVSQPSPVYMDYARTAAELSTAIEPGRQSVTIVLEVVFAIG